MAAVAFGGVWRYAAVRLYPLVVVSRAAEGGEYGSIVVVGVDGDGFLYFRYVRYRIVLIRYSTLLFFVLRNLGPQEEKARVRDDFLLI